MKLNRIKIVLKKEDIIFFGLVILLTFYFFMASLQIKFVNQPTIRPAYIFSLIFISLLFFFNILISRSFPFPKEKQYYLFYILVFYLFFKSLLSDVRAIKDFLYFFYWFILFSSVLSFYYSKFKRINYYKSEMFVCIAVIIFALFSCIISIVMYYELVPIHIFGYEFIHQKWLENRLHGLMGEATSLGGLIGLCLLCLIYIYNKKRKSLLVILLFIFFIVCIIWAGSRNGLLSFILSILVSFFLNKNKSNQYKIVALCILFVIFISTLIFIFVKKENSLIYDIESSSSPLNRGDMEENFNDNRLFIWKNVISLYCSSDWDDLLFGAGPSAIDRMYRSAFNTSIEILFNYGLFALIIFLSMYTFSFYYGLKKYRKTCDNRYLFGITLIAYSFFFSMFLSIFPAYFFNFPSFSFILGQILIGKKY